MVENIIITLLQIVIKVWKWKNFWKSVNSRWRYGQK